MKLLSHVHIKDSGDEIMVFDSHTGELYSAESVSKEIFMLLRDEVTEKEIFSHLSDLYPQQLKQNIESDALAFINTLKKYKLINDKKN